MPKLYNYSFYFSGKRTYTAETYEEALEQLSDEMGDVEINDCDTEEFDPDIDDYMGGN